MENKHDRDIITKKHIPLGFIPTTTPRAYTTVNYLNLTKTHTQHNKTDSMYNSTYVLVIDMGAFGSLSGTESSTSTSKLEKRVERVSYNAH